ncbi:rust resistance kinase Lr10 isoform X2 [Morus notabilis]|uniref:rust resistance kinase Lr10 isoform X2 n=1 Tax=Morus notabilis TaxID=981085 RepID=UPI000CED2DD8|nr:rust resistance kinase Lr10 isoform X2 [Morus notabilis]
MGRLLQYVKDDGNGNLVFSDFPDNSRSDGFNNIEDQFSSSMKWAVIGSVVSGLIGTVAIIMIVYAIIDCLKKCGSAVPAYAKIATSDTKIEEASNQKLSSPNKEEIAKPEIPVILSNSEAEYATIERFLSKMAREKPVRFSSAQLEEFTDNFATVLGSGGFGVVFKGVLPINGVHLAVKMLNNNWDKRVEEQFMAEVATLGRTYHINLVKLYGFCFDPSTKALVYEYMENGSLDKILFDESREIEWEKLHDIAVQTGKGIAYLHEGCERKIIHYDIKPGNVLLDKNLNPKVADFGLAKLCNSEGSQRTLMVDGRGTPGYAAPEMWKPYPVTHKCDVYSFGILLFEIVGRRRHFDEGLSESRQWLPKWAWEMYEHMELKVMLSLCGVEERNREKAERMLIVALWCIQNSPEERPSMSNVVQMLEGSKEVNPPPCPFDHRPSPGSMFSAARGGNDRESSDTYSSSKTSFGKIHSNHVQNTFEIELASE